MKKIKECIKRIKFAWNAIRYGIPPEFKPEPAHHYITEHRMDIENVQFEYRINKRIPEDVQYNQALKSYIHFIEPYIEKEEKYQIGEEYSQRLTLKVAVER